jgi:4-nitrophenyl phosphatase
MTRYPLYIFDLDGTLFRGAAAIPGAVETVAELRAGGSQVRYVTNNSTLARDSYVEKLSRMGFPAEAGWVYSSALGAAEYLRGAVTRAHVVGERGLTAALEAVGIQSGDAEHPEVVVVGLCRQFDYARMTRAMHHLLDPGVRFLATNRDAALPIEGGQLIPGAGAIVAALATCSGRDPELVGKPSPYLIEWILRETAIEPQDALVVGDRVETDIVAGQRAGCAVHLVLTGVATSAPAGVAWSPDLTGVLTRGLASKQ